MLCHDIFEARTTLPLDKGVMAQARDAKGGLLAVMSPMDFLRLTTENEADIDEIFSDEFTTLDDYGSKTPNAPDADPLYHKSMYFLPFLIVSYPSGKVEGHEGRHRAAMVARAGGMKFPVNLRFRSDRRYLLSYTEINHDTDEETDKTEVFNNIKAVEQRKRELQKLADESRNMFYGYFKSDDEGGIPLRYNPDSNARWAPTDMPAQLISQFNPSVVIPTSRMRIGVIK